MHYLVWAIVLTVAAITLVTLSFILDLLVRVL